MVVCQMLQVTVCVCVCDKSRITGVGLMPVYVW